jgi:uncharacterized protein (TIGR00297 family)
VLARCAGALTTGGAVAGAAVGLGVAFGMGASGVWVLGAFFVIGSAATKLGWARKSAEGTAERGGGARDARRVVGKGGVAALAGAMAGLAVASDAPWPALSIGALAAALADTLGTEIGILSRGTPRLIPSLRAVPRGTPGAVSIAGTLAAAIGAGLIAATALIAGLMDAGPAALCAATGFVGAMLESVVTAAAPGARRVPGWVRNLMTTGIGGGLAFALSWGVR